MSNVSEALKHKFKGNSDCQNVEELDEVTIEMFNALQAEVDDLYGKVGKMQNELKGLSKSIQNLAVDTGVVGSIELAEIKALIGVSNKQDADIQKLIYFNGLWQKNFRVVNTTFEKLKKRVIIVIPPMSKPEAVPAASHRVMTQVQIRNVTAFELSPRPIRKMAQLKTGKEKSGNARPNNPVGRRRNGTDIRTS